MSEFSTMNESRLHKTLKAFYAARHDAKTEVQIEKWFCDIVCPDDTIIEIQTKNIGALKEKLRGLLKSKRKVIVVHPIIREKIIVTEDENGNEVRRAKSPRRESLYSALREFTGIYDLLLKRNFSIVCPFVKVEERRVRLDEPVQSKNKRRRFKAKWLKTDKALLEMGEEHLFHGKKSFLALLPKGLPKEFCSADLAAAIIAASAGASEKQPAAQKSDAKYANLTLWLLHKTGLIERTQKKGRHFYYKIAESRL